MARFQIFSEGFLSPNRSHLPNAIAVSLAVMLASSMALQAEEGKAAGSGQPAAIRHKLQVNNPETAAQLESTGARLIADYGGYALYEAVSVDAGLAAAPGVELRDDYNLILLNAVRLDTSLAETQALRQSPGAFTGKRTHLVQFAGPVQPAWREALLETGVQIISYIPRNSYLIYGDAAALAAVQALAARMPILQWDGAYAAEYKIAPLARPVDAAGNPLPNPPTTFVIQLFADPEANAATLQLLDQLKLEPIAEQNRVLHYLNVTVSLSPENLTRVASRPDVVSIHPYIEPEKYDERQDQIVAGNIVGNAPAAPGYLAWLLSKGFTQAQFTTSGFGVDISDSGIDNGTTNVNHPGLHVLGVDTNPSRVLYSRIEGSGSVVAGCDGHGNLNAHVVGGYNDLSGFPFADSLGYRYGLGVCPFVKVGASVIFAPSYTRPNYTTLQARAYRDGARISNNSWGANQRGAYTAASQEYDALVRDAQPSTSPLPIPGNQEMVIVFASGNAGPSSRSVGAPASAKNVITVGAAENWQPFGEPDWCVFSDSDADSANDMADYSSRGPCTDGRRKPEIVAPGTRVFGGVVQAPNYDPMMGTADSCYNAGGVCGDYWDGFFYPTNQEFYTISTGTSHAAPAVAGGAALLRQWFINKLRTTPSAAMTKAFLVNSTRYMTGASADDDLWSNTQGMGEMNLGTAFDDTRRLLRDQLPGDVFTASGQVRTIMGSVNDPTRPFRVTLAWTDAPGATSGDAFNNDLDLEVTIRNVTYKGNVFNDDVSAPGGAADSRNNLESVFLPPGQSGPFTITIRAANLNSDGIPNNTQPIDQDFALVMSNAKPSAPQINWIAPTNLLVVTEQYASFMVDAIGEDPLRYQWRKDGTNIAGANSNTWWIASARLSDAGGYSVVVSDVNGSSTSAVVRLTVLPSVPLPFALNNSNYVWMVDTNMPWYGQTNVSHDKVASGRSFPVVGSQSTYLEMTNVGPGTLSFWWKVNSATNAGLCSFVCYDGSYTNGTQILGPRDWTNETFYLPSGVSTSRWSYTDSSLELFLTNGAFIDQISFVPGGVLPFVTLEPTNQAILGANPVLFSVVANGTPPLSYQWTFNGLAITNATNNVLAIENAGPYDIGSYVAVISNEFGIAFSTNAQLEVAPIVIGGDNIFGQTGATISATNVVGVSAGAFHTLAVRRDGVVLAWGNNSAGQCAPPPALNDAMAVAGGGMHSLALRADGTVVGWGDNSAGQATPPPGLSNVTAIAAGNRHSVALKTDGTVVAWGDHTLGQTNVPPGLSGVVAIAVGGDHTLVLKADGTLAAWGANNDPDWNFAGQSIVPWGLANVTAIAAGNFHNLALKGDGAISAWGFNGYGEIAIPVDATNIIALAAGNQFSVALRDNRSLQGWGLNWNNQCDFSPSLTNVIAFSTGDAHAVVLLGKPGNPPELVRALRSGSQFSLWVQTMTGKNYALESANLLEGPQWSTVSWLRGNGAMLLFVDHAAGGPQRFYRIRAW